LPYNFAIQLAKYLGSHVATTVRSAEKDYARKIRADEIIDYEKQAFEDLLQNFDAVSDTVGGETYARSFKILRKDSVIVSMLEQPREELMKKYGVRAIGQFTGVNNARLSKLAEFVDKRAIKVFIDKIYPLEQASEALEYLKKYYPRGKVILKMKD
jgi:alcohol dehydrogenase